MWLLNSTISCTNIDWRGIQNIKTIRLRKDPNLITNHIIIRAIRNLWNLISLNNNKKGKNFKKNRSHFFTKIIKKKLSAMDTKKLDISNRIIDSNNSNHNYISKELYK